MIQPSRTASPFNSPLETGVRSLGVLAASFPLSFDLQRLVVYDHLVVHTGDLGGPPSLHPRLPLRSAEMLIRRGLVERGIGLMMSRGLIVRVVDNNGFSYRASELAGTILDSFESEYLRELRFRANWVAEQFSDSSDEEIRRTMENIFEKWIDQFHSSKLQPEIVQ